MKKCSQNYIEQLESRSQSARAYITLADGTKIETLSNENFSLSNTCYQDGYIIGNNIAKSVEFEVYDSGYNLENQEFQLYIGLYIEETETFEYFNFGTFMIDTYERDVVSKKTKIKAFDYMIKFNSEYVDDNDYLTNPITLKEYIINFCNYYGVELGTTTFINENFEITSTPATEGETGRTILKYLGELTCTFCEIGADNKLYFKFFEEDETKRFEIPRNLVSSLTISEELTPINSVVIKLGGDIDGENVSKYDEESIELYGEKTLTIEDNPFLPTSVERAKVIDAIYEKIYGFKYIPFSITAGTNPLILETGDLLSVPNDEGTHFNSILLSQTLSIPNLAKSTIGATALTIVEETNKYTSEENNLNKKAEIMVYKLEGKIEQTTKNIETIEKENASSIREINEKFNGYVLANDYATLESTVQQIQTDTYTKTEINTKLVDGSVEMVKTSLVTVDDNGTTWEKSEAPVKANVDAYGLQILDKTGNSSEDLLGAKYDVETGETRVWAKNMTVNKYLNVCDSIRIEIFDAGIGFFEL